MLMRARRVWWILAFCVFALATLACLVWVVRSTDAFAYCTRDRKQYKEYQSLHEQTFLIVKFFIRGGLDSACVAHAINVYHDVVTALSSVVVAAFTGTLWWVTRGMVNSVRAEFIASHRPRLRVRNISVDPPSVGNEPPTIFRHNHVVKGHYFVANYGDSPAHIIETYSQVFWTDRPLPMERPYAQEIGSHLPGVQICSGGAKKIQFSSDRPITERESGAVLIDSGGWIYVMGWIEYADDAGTRRRTAFCQKYDASKRRFYPVSDRDYEHEE